MPRYVPISRTNHAGKTWKRAQTYGFASRQPVAPVVGLELATAAVNMPLGFIRQGENYHLAALLSFGQDSNLFVGTDGRWAGTYIPAAFRSYPFRLMRQEGGEQMMVCVDEESDLVRDDDEGEAFFQDGGKPSKLVNQIADFLQQYEASRLATDIAVKALDEAGVIGPWEITVKGKDRELPVTGLFRIDETKLNALDDQTYLGLRKAGALGVAYAQIVSMNRLEVLGRLAEHHENVAKARQQAKPLPELDELFGNDDKLIF
ncbi:SapC family protein [Chelativorans multitrophicus]|uniref:SapC family protein n=1 Tax=Chelativorans multitrophicus TaxID=449973 RepID=UPI00140C5ECC|nr:SapC family protein [Chelativorans multitrophicus]